MPSYRDTLGSARARWVAALLAGALASAAAAGPQSTGGAGGAAPPAPESAPVTPDTPPASTPPRSGGGPGSDGTGPTAPGRAADAELFNAGEFALDAPAAWESWWRYHQHEFIELRERARSGGVVEGSAEDFLGPRARQPWSSRRPTSTGVRADVLPALRRVFESDANATVRGAAALALAKLGLDPLADRPLAGVDVALGDGQLEFAQSAALALGVGGGEASIEVLLELLRQDLAALRKRRIDIDGPVSERVRAFAAYGLGLCASRAATPARERIGRALLDWLEDGGALASVDDAPAAAVLALGLAPLALDARVSAGPSRAPAADSRDTQLRRLLELLVDRRAAPAVRAQLPASIAALAADLPRKHWLRPLAVQLCAERLDPRVKEAPAVQYGCAQALGRLADADLDRHDVQARVALRLAYERGKGRAESHVALFAWARACSRSGGGENASAALEEARARLIEDLGRATGMERAWTALALAQFERTLAERCEPQSAAAGAALRAAFKKARSPDELGACALALGIARERQAAAALRERLDSGAEPRARGYVALALGMVGDVESSARLRALAEGSSAQRELFEPALTALVLLGDDGAVPRCAQMLTDSARAQARGTIALALGRCGDARALPSLLHFLDKQASSAAERVVAVTALGACCERGARPWNAVLAERANYFAGPPTLSTPFARSGVIDLE